MLVIDRGYASKELIQVIISHKIRFLMRLKQNFDVGIDALLQGSFET
jgi:hypothetical protein